MEAVPGVDVAGAQELATLRLLEALRGATMGLQLRHGVLYPFTTAATGAPVQDFAIPLESQYSPVAPVSDGQLSQ